jgi:hypothetical protein
VALPTKYCAVTAPAHTMAVRMSRDDGHGE